MTHPMLARTLFHLDAARAALDSYLATLEKTNANSQAIDQYRAALEEIESVNTTLGEISDLTDV